MSSSTTTTPSQPPPPPKPPQSMVSSNTILSPVTNPTPAPPPSLLSPENNSRLHVAISLILASNRSLFEKASLEVGPPPPPPPAVRRGLGLTQPDPSRETRHLSTKVASIVLEVETASKNCGLGLQSKNQHGDSTVNDVRGCWVHGELLPRLRDYNPWKLALDQKIDKTALSNALSAWISPSSAPEAKLVLQLISKTIIPTTWWNDYAPFLYDAGILKQLGFLLKSTQDISLLDEAFFYLCGVCDDNRAASFVQPLLPSFIASFLTSLYRFPASGIASKCAVIGQLIGRLVIVSREIVAFGEETIRALVAKAKEEEALAVDGNTQHDIMVGSFIRGTHDIVRALWQWFPVPTRNKLIELLAETAADSFHTARSESTRQSSCDLLVMLCKLAPRFCALFGEGNLQNVIKSLYAKIQDCKAPLCVEAIESLLGLLECTETRKTAVKLFSSAVAKGLLRFAEEEGLSTGVIRSQLLSLSLLTNESPDCGRMVAQQWDNYLKPMLKQQMNDDWHVYGFVFCVDSMLVLRSELAAHGIHVSLPDDLFADYQCLRQLLDLASAETEYNKSVAHSTRRRAPGDAPTRDGCPPEESQLRPTLPAPRCARCCRATANLCSGCKRTFYCSLDCQKAQWKEHKAECRKQL